MVVLREGMVLTSQTNLGDLVDVLSSTNLTLIGGCTHSLKTQRIEVKDHLMEIGDHVVCGSAVLGRHSFVR